MRKKYYHDGFTVESHKCAICGKNINVDPSVYTENDGAQCPSCGRFLCYKCAEFTPDDNVDLCSVCFFKNVNKFDLLIYCLDNGVEVGAVLGVYDDGDVRTDTDGNICNSDILGVVKGAGKQFIYDSKGYRDSVIYQDYLFENYGLEIQPSVLSLESECKNAGGI